MSTRKAVPPHCWPNTLCPSDVFTDGLKERMLIPLITICLGLIIGYGLQQIIALVQRRRNIRKARAAELAARKPGE